MIIITSTISFIFGTIIASFLGLLIIRSREFSWKNIKSILIWRSQCDSCKTTLKVRQLIPLRWYLLQRGRCSFCNTKIPQRMSWFEMSWGIMFVCVSYFLGQWPELWYRRGVSALLLGLVVADILYMEVNLSLFFLLLLLLIFYHLSVWILSYTRLRSGTLLGVFFCIYGSGWIIARMKFGKRQEGFGFGDVLVSIPIGLILGQILGNLDTFDRFWRINIYMLLSSVCMLVYILIVKKNQKSWDQEVYFPFLVGMIVGLIAVGCWLIAIGQ